MKASFLGSFDIDDHSHGIYIRTKSKLFPDLPVDIQQPIPEIKTLTFFVSSCHWLKK